MSSLPVSEFSHVCRFHMSVISWIIFIMTIRLSSLVHKVLLYTVYTLLLQGTTVLFIELVRN